MIPSPLQYGFYRRTLGNIGTWTPAQLSSTPYMWLNDSSAVTDAGAGACSQWNDISGNAYHFDQSAGPAQPLIVPAAQNNRRIIRFDGTDDYLRQSSIGARNVFNGQTQGWVAMVMKKNVLSSPSTADQISFAAQDGSGSGLKRILIGVNAAVPDAVLMSVRRLDADPSGGTTITTPLTVAFNAYVGRMNWGTGVAQLIKDGTLAAFNNTATTTGSTSATTSVVSIILGGYGSGIAPSSGVLCSNIDVGELIVGRTLPSTDEQWKLEGYLAWRWGLQANLPSNHPYRWFSP